MRRELSQNSPPLEGWRAAQLIDGVVYGSEKLKVGQTIVSIAERHIPLLSFSSLPTLLPYFER
jgi:hypothetical protein